MWRFVELILNLFANLVFVVVLLVGGCLFVWVCVRLFLLFSLAAVFVG